MRRQRDGEYRKREKEKTGKKEMDSKKAERISEDKKSERKKGEKDIFFSSCLKIFRSYEDVHVTWLLTIADERLQN